MHFFKKSISLALCFCIFSNVLYGQIYDYKQQFYTINNFKTSNGSVIKECKLGFRVYGKLNNQKSNAVLIPTWFGGKSTQKSFVAAPSGLADSSKNFIIIVDALGNGISSSPSNTDNFPEISIVDMVNAEYELVTKKLGLNKLKAVMGISMGGMQTFQWLSSYPDFVEKAIPIIGTPSQTSYDKLFWNIQLNLLERSNYSADAFKTVAAIHELNLRTPTNIAREQKPSDYSSFISKSEANYAANNDARNWASQLRAMINHDIYSNGFDASKLKAKLMIVVADQDHMVNPQPAIDLGKKLNVPVVILPGDCGHKATSCQEAMMLSFVKAFLD